MKGFGGLGFGVSLSKGPTEARAQMFQVVWFYHGFSRVLVSFCGGEACMQILQRLSVSQHSPLVRSWYVGDDKGDW